MSADTGMLGPGGGMFGRTAGIAWLDIPGCGKAWGCIGGGAGFQAPWGAEAPGMKSAASAGDSRITVRPPSSSSACGSAPKPPSGTPNARVAGGGLELIVAGGGPNPGRGAAGSWIGGALG